MIENEVSSNIIDEDNNKSFIEEIEPVNEIIIKIEENKIFVEDDNNYTRLFVYGISINDFKNVNYQDNFRLLLIYLLFYLINKNY